MRVDVVFADNGLQSEVNAEPNSNANLSADADARSVRGRRPDRPLRKRADRCAPRTDAAQRCQQSYRQATFSGSAFLGAMNFPNIIPPSDLLQQVDGVESGLRQQRRLGILGRTGLILSVAAQVTVLILNSQYAQDLWASLTNLSIPRLITAVKMRYPMSPRTAPVKGRARCQKL